ncbi:hypothetical protein GCM10009801_15270 [Streptomyces albiaxialis]|uniref:DUF397 domain-containing protein n=1 Tax=Streptomyces albiaxialis TaxID=329523 RepID=A0ABP5H8M4_9ACTN
MCDHLRWRRSSYSTGANNCVETARSDDGRLAVRDSKRTRDGDGHVLLFAGDAWTSFVSALRETTGTGNGGREVSGVT